MSRRLISRRHFLRLPLTFLLAPHVAWPARGWAATTSEERKRTYSADVGILYGLLSFRLDGALSAAIDRAAGHYQVTIAVGGAALANLIEARGLLRDGRLSPLEWRSWCSVKGQELRS